MPCESFEVEATEKLICKAPLFASDFFVQKTHIFVLISNFRSIAAAIFDGDELAEAIGVPVYYGFVESVFVSLYCVWAWKAGWTKAPTDVSLWKAITTSYEVLALDDADINGDGIQLPMTTDKSQRTAGEEWNYVNHEDAQQNANTTTAEPEKKEGGSWFGLM